MTHGDIGLVGLAGSGKDTAAALFVGKGWRHKAFARKLKYLALTLGWDGVKDEAGRRFLQDLGMAARAYNPNTWIHFVAKEIFGAAPEFKDIPFVWSDVRFENEAEFIRNRGGVIIRIVRPNLQADEHESESGQNKIDADYTIVNDGTVEDLHNTILRLLQTHD